MAVFTSTAQQETLREAGRRLAAILNEVKGKAAAGVSAKELNDLAEKLIRDGGDEPAFLNYTPEGAPRPYPATLCVSMNDEIVHGIPNEEEKILKEGDIVGLDLGLVHEGVIVDSAVTVAIGGGDENAKKLMRATREALDAGISMARVGNRIGDISHAVEEVAKKYGYDIPVDLGGHGVGDQVHEAPYVANEGHPGTGEEIVSGLVLAIEPMLTEGGKGIVTDRDGYTVRTKKGTRAAHFEHTVLITPQGPEVVTRG